MIDAPEGRGKSANIAQVDDATVVEAFTNFGLSEVEISVYQAVLSLGARPASIIAQKAGLKRGHTYNLLEGLMSKGMVQEFVKQGVRHFTASPPRQLLTIIEHRQEELAQQKEKIIAAIPFLEQLRNPLLAEPKVRFFKGVDGIKEIFEDMLLVPDETIVGIVDLRHSWSMSSEAGQAWVQSFIRRREQKNISWNGIIVKSSVADQSLGGRSSRLQKRKMLQGYEIPAEMHVYCSKVAFASTSSEMVGVIIESQPISQTIRSLLEFWCSILPDYSLNENGEPAEGISDRTRNLSAFSGR